MSENNQKNILYILGAGASAGALPVVSEMKERIESYLNMILCFYSDKNFDFFNVFSLEEENINKMKEFYNNIIRYSKDILNNIKTRRSIDTYAKELNLQSEVEKYKFLKRQLSIYLKFEEMYSDDDIRIYMTSNKNNNTSWHEAHKYYFESNIIGESYDLESKYIHDKLNIDQRYINFLIDIMGDPMSLKKIKIYSWNYDTQLDLARESLGINNVDSKQKDGQLEILQKMEVKINGSIEKNKNTKDKENTEDKEIKFAWEHGKDFTFLKLEENEEWFKNVTDIVIIGYSFPFSNRKTDLEIFKKLLSIRWEQIYSKEIELSDYNSQLYNIQPLELLANERRGGIENEIRKLVKEIENMKLENKMNFYIQIPKPENEKDDNYESIKESLESILQEAGFKKEWYTIIRKTDKTSFFIPPHY